MSGFISSPAPDISAPGKMLACGPFWPDVDLNHFRDAERIGGTLIPDARVEQALLQAVLTVEGDLAKWRAVQEELGFTSLDTVPSASIGGQHRYGLLWRQAVYALATAELIETHRDVSATGQGRSDGLDNRADDHRRVSLHAIRAIKGVGRTAVGLV